MKQGQLQTLECRLIRVVLAAGRTTRFRSGPEELYIHEDVIRVLHLLFRIKVSKSHSPWELSRMKICASKVLVKFFPLFCMSHSRHIQNVLLKAHSSPKLLPQCPDLCTNKVSHKCSRKETFLGLFAA